MPVYMNLPEDYALTPDTTIDVLVRYCSFRIKKKKNVLMCIVGGTGSGKSLAAVALADAIQKKTLNKPFLARQIVFSGTDFMKQVEVLPHGSVIIWDEIGVGLNARRAMSNINILLNNIFQTFRHQQFVVILTTPDFSYIDVACRKLLHLYMKTERIDWKSNLNRIRLLSCRNNPRMGKMYYHRFICKIRKGENAFMPNWYAPLPRQDLWDDYEKVKKHFTDGLNESTRIFLEENESIAKLRPEEQRIWDMNQAGMKNIEISEEVGLGARQVSAILVRACRKLGKTKRNNHDPTANFGRFKDMSPIDIKREAATAKMSHILYQPLTDTAKVGEKGRFINGLKDFGTLAEAKQEGVSDNDH